MIYKINIKNNEKERRNGASGTGVSQKKLLISEKTSKKLKACSNGSEVGGQLGLRLAEWGEVRARRESTGYNKCFVSKICLV